MRITILCFCALLSGCVTDVHRESERVIVIGFMFRSTKSKIGEYDPSQAITDLEIDVDPLKRKGSLKLKRGPGDDVIE